jgi:hypothetical protein
MSPRQETGIFRSQKSNFDPFRVIGLVSGVGILMILLAAVTASNKSLTKSAKAANLSSGSTVCETIEQVNDSAFGLGTGSDNSFASEEGFELAVFNDQLYVGMEADNSLGARLWRTKSGITQPVNQMDWEEVIADEAGYPFGILNRAQADHIDSLAVFNGYIFASTANGGSNILGTRIFRSSTGDPGRWEDAIANYGAGFGDVDNMNFKDMQVFDGWLCGGTQNWRRGAQVWCTQDGNTWSQKNISGFGHNRDDYTNREIWSGSVFNGAIYFGVQNLGDNLGSSTDDVGKLYRTNDLSGDPKWSEVFSGLPGSYRVDLLGSLNNYLYISVRSPGGMVVFRSQDGNANSWNQVNIPGMDGDAQNMGVIVDSATILDGSLYLGISNTATGFELWRTSGSPQEGSAQVDWMKVGGEGLVDAKNVLAELITFNDKLYAWTTNYISGQQVLRLDCSSNNISSPTPTEIPSNSPTPSPTSTFVITPTSTETPPHTPTASIQPTGEPSTTVTSTVLPTLVPTSTKTPTPTFVCLNDTVNCQEPYIGSGNQISLYLPLAIKSWP